jgi:hypothetical protein
MLKLYKKERIQEDELVIEDDFEVIPYSSVSLFINNLNFNETFLNQMTSNLWENFALEMFKSAMLSLLISKKINVIYFVDKKSIFFNQFEYNSEGFKIYTTKKTVVDQDDLLEDAILSAIQKVNFPDYENFRSVVYDIINQYIGKKVMNKPEKKFILEYLKDYSNKNLRFKLKSNKKWWGLKYEIEIDEDKKAELTKSFQNIKRKFSEFNRKDLIIRKFLAYIENVVAKDLSSRNPSSD